MITLILAAVLILPVICCIKKQIAAIREIFRRSSYDGRCSGIVVSREQVGLFYPRRWEYTVKYTVNGEDFTFSFRHHEPEDPLQTGAELPVIYPAENPACGCALHDTECFQQRTDALIRRGFLIAAEAFLCMLLGTVLPSRIQLIAVNTCLAIFILSLLLIGIFFLGLRIYWLRQSIRTTGTVLACSRGFRRQQMIRTVGYEADGESFVFTDTNTADHMHVYQFGDPMPIRYLRRAHFIARCADQSVFLTVTRILLVLLYIGALLYFLIRFIAEIR